MVVHCTSCKEKQRNNLLDMALHISPCPWKMINQWLKQPSLATHAKGTLKKPKWGNGTNDAHISKFGSCKKIFFNPGLSSDPPRYLILKKNKEISSCKIKEYCGSNELDFRGNPEMVPATDDESHRLCLLPTFADYEKTSFFALHLNGHYYKIIYIFSKDLTDRKKSVIYKQCHQII